MRELLPIGSVVLLKGATKRLFIVGRAQSVDNGEMLYDYSGCLYPEGYVSADDMFLFNHADIETIYSIGYQDDMEFAMRRYIGEKLVELGYE